MSERQYQYMRFAEAMYKKYSPKNQARKLGIPYRTYMRHLRGDTISLEQWQARRGPSPGTRRAVQKYSGMPVMHDGLVNYRRTSFTNSDN